ncbi:MAG: hypothetical protein R2851_22165 [Caldilineaceae bacterium]
MSAETIADQIAALGEDTALLQDQAWRDEEVLSAAATRWPSPSQQVRGLEPPDPLCRRACGPAFGGRFLRSGGRTGE